MNELKARKILGVDKNASISDIETAFNRKTNQLEEITKIIEINLAYNFLMELESYKILRIDKSVEFEKVKKAHRDRVKEYHSDVNKSPEAEIKIREINLAYEFLLKIEKKKKSKIENEKAFDDLDAFIKEKEAELKGLKCNIHPKYKKDLLNPEKRGIIEAEELNKEKERLKQKYANIIDSVKAFDKLKATIDNAKKQLVKWNLNNLELSFNKDANIKIELRGKAPAIELERLCVDIEKTMAQIKENIEELNSFLKYIDSIAEKIKKIEPETDIEALKKKYEKQKGIISVKEIKIEREKLQNKFDSKKHSVSEFLKFYEETEARLRELYNADLGMWNDYNNANTLYSISDDVLVNVRRAIENYEKILKERTFSYDSFLSYYEKFSKEEQEEFKTLFNLDDYLEKKNRVMFEKAIYDELKEKISNYKKEKEEEQASSKAFEEFIIFFSTKETELKKLYGVDLSKWRKYAVEKHSIKEIANVRQEIIEYEKDLKERAVAYDEFLAYYDKLPGEQKKIYESVTDIKKYIAKGSRLLYTKDTYDELKEKVEKFKKEKENEYLDKIEKKDELKKMYEKDLREKSIAYDEFMSYYNALSEEEKTIYESYTDINKYIDEKSRFLYSKETYEKLKEQAMKVKEEKAYLNALNEFHNFFDVKESEIENLYGLLLSKWQKYRDIKRPNIEELNIAKQEIIEYEKELAENVKAFDDFLMFYESLSDEDKELLHENDMDFYLSKNNRALFSKKFFEELKEEFLEIKRLKEENKTKVLYERTKKEFISSFYEKEKLFKSLYEIDLYKWRKYSLEENNFPLEEYLKVKEEIDALEEEKENERMSKLYNLQLALKKLDVDIADYLSYKKTDYKNVSIGDLNNYLEDFFNISYIMGLIKDLNGGTEKLNNYLKEQGKGFWLLPFEEIYKKLFDLYSAVCIEVAKVEEKRNNKEKDESFTNFRKLYQEKKKVFNELYNKELSKWDSYVKEENKEKYSKKDYDDAIKELKEEEKMLEEERMSLEYDLQVILKNLGIDIVEYLNIRGKDILSVSKKDLKEYLKATYLLLKISVSSRGRDLLTSYLEENKIKVAEVDYKSLLIIHAMINIEQKMDEQDIYDEKYENGFK